MDAGSQGRQVEEKGGQGQNLGAHPFWLGEERKAKKSTGKGGRSQERWLKYSTVFI